MPIKHQKLQNRAILKKYGYTFCAAPFVSLYEGENGILTSCCKSTTAIGNTSKDSYEDAVNSDQMKQLRLDFLKGDKPKQCNACWDRENIEFAQAPVRQFNNDITDLARLDHIINNMNEDGTIVEQMPVWLDLLSTNKCNFSCLGCKPHLSSTIAKQYNKEFKILHDNKGDDAYWGEWTDEWTNENKPRIDYILKYGHTIKEIHLNGGEPFLSAGTYELLDAMIEAGLNETITLWSHTNGSILKNYKGKDLIKDYFAKWKNCRITLSNDGFGIVGEYIRYGYTDNKWQEVFLKIVEHPHISVNVNCCLNIFNIFHLAKWTESFLELSQKTNRSLDQDWLVLNMWDDNSVSIRMLGLCEETKTRAINSINALLKTDNINRLPKLWKSKISSFKLSIENSTMPKEKTIQAFVLGVDALEKKRNIKFADACPELLQLYQKAKTFI